MKIGIRCWACLLGCVASLSSGCAADISIGHDDARLNGRAGGGKTSTNTGGETTSAGVGGSGSSTSNLGPAAEEAATYTTMSFNVVAGDAVCISLALPADDNGQNDCRVIELVLGDRCDCTKSGRGPATAAQIAVARTSLHRVGSICDGEGLPGCSAFCGCELLQMKGDALESCREDIDINPSAAGWCYVDPENGLGNAELTAPGSGCTSTQSKLLRPQPLGLAPPEAPNMPIPLTFMACALKSAEVAPPPRGTGELGAPCASSIGSGADLLSIDTDSAWVDTASPDCATGLCLLNHVSYVSDFATPDPPSNREAHCSCRCDGPAAAGPFCACPSGFECAHVVDDIGLGSAKEVVGSYCVKSGTPAP